MAHRAISLDVAADAGIEVALGLPGVVTGAPWTVRPHDLGRVEAPALGGIGERAGQGEAEALMAGQTKRLLAMAAGALLLVLASRDGVHAEPVVRMNAAWSNSTIVAVGAVFLAMAVGAEAAVVPRHQLVALDPIRTVSCVMQPTRRQQGSRLETHFEPAVQVRQVAAAAVGARSARSGLRILVAVEATAHAGQLVAACLLEIFQRAMALRAADIARGVQRMIKAQIGLGQGGARDLVAGRAAVAPMADSARAERRGGVGANPLQLAMVGAVTAVAVGASGQQRLRGVVTAARLVMTAGARKP